MRPSPEPTTARRIGGYLRIAVGLGLLGVIVIQITDRVVNDAFDPLEYFSYFTIETSLINIVVFLVGGWMALTSITDTRLYTTVRMTTIGFAVVTALVYNVVLRNQPYQGGYAGLSWPSEVIHVVVPLLIVLDWLLSPGRPPLPRRAAWAMVVYPVAWLIYTMVRGALSDSYPYPVLDPATAGWLSVIAHTAGMLGLMVVIGVLATAYSRQQARTRSIPQRQSKQAVRSEEPG